MFHQHVTLHSLTSHVPPAHVTRHFFTSHVPPAHVIRHSHMSHFKLAHITLHSRKSHAPLAHITHHSVTSHVPLSHMSHHSRMSQIPLAHVGWGGGVVHLAIPLYVLQRSRFNLSLPSCFHLTLLFFHVKNIEWPSHEAELRSPAPETMSYL